MDGEQIKQNTWKYVPALTIILSLFLVVQIVNGLKNAGTGVPAQDVITVSGQGEVFATPDLATFTFSVTEVGNNVKDAQTKTTEKIDKAIAAVKKLGVDEKDIKTTDYNAYPKYEYNQIECIKYPCPVGKQQLVGYEVSQTILVKVRKVDDAGKLLDAVASASITNVSGLTFTIDDESALQREARKKAIDDAKTKAQQLAKDLGVSLSRIVSFSENNGSPMPMYYRADAIAMGGAMEAKSVPSVPTGQNKISSDVSITYEIK